MKQMQYYLPMLVVLHMPCPCFIAVMNFPAATGAKLAQIVRFLNTPGCTDYVLPAEFRGLRHADDADFTLGERHFYSMLGK
jgi:hypothetical protein